MHVDISLVNIYYKRQCKSMLTVNSCIKVCLDLQADKSPVSQGTLLPSSGEPKVLNLWNKCVMQEMI
jgi:hypothetical protein